jgi:hypothetical protein
VRRRMRLAALAATSVLLAGCGSKPHAALFVYTAPRAGTAQFGVTKGSRFGISLEGVAPGTRVSVSVSPDGIVTTPAPAGGTDGRALFTASALHTGTATVTFACTACGPSGTLPVQVRVWPGP